MSSTSRHFGQKFFLTKVVGNEQRNPQFQPPKMVVSLTVMNWSSVQLPLASPDNRSCRSSCRRKQSRTRRLCPTPGPPDQTLVMTLHTAHLIYTARKYEQYTVHTAIYAEQCADCYTCVTRESTSSRSPPPPPPKVPVALAFSRARIWT